jgi:hypothetical protein
LKVNIPPVSESRSVGNGFLKYRADVQARKLEVLELADFGKLQQLLNLSCHEIDVLQQHVSIGHAAELDVGAHECQRRLQFVCGGSKEPHSGEKGPPNQAARPLKAVFEGQIHGFEG